MRSDAFARPANFVPDVTCAAAERKRDLSMAEIEIPLFVPYKTVDFCRRSFFL